ncbi:MAG: alpha/beta hydrolase [Gammaproteobacteria bacterium]|nr:alpha/beta hydrolase [Gammaproteobacteria bacterium]
MATFQTDDDVSIYYEDTGSGTPILFVHEFGGDYRSWYRQVPILSQSYRCISFSARGFLPSAIPESRDQYGQEFSTRDVLALINHLNLDAVHLVGTSMGSFTSLDFALNHPDRVRSATLVGNSSGPRDSVEQVGYRQDWVGHEIRLRKTEGVEGAVAVLTNDPAYQSFQENDPGGWAIYTGNLHEQSVKGAIHILSTLHWDRRSLFDDRQRLKTLEVPILLITGNEDCYLVRETNVFLKEILPNVIWRDFEGTGHLVNIERASEFNALLTQFITL